MARQSFVDPPLALPVRITLDIFDVVFVQYAFRFVGLQSDALAGESHKCCTLER